MDDSVGELFKKPISRETLFRYSGRGIPIAPLIYLEPCYWFGDRSPIGIYVGSGGDRSLQLLSD